MDRWVAGCCSVADVTERAASVTNIQLAEAFKDVTPALLSLQPETLSQIKDHAQSTSLQRLLLLAFQYSLVVPQKSFSELLLPSDTTGIHTLFRSSLDSLGHDSNDLCGTSLDADELNRRIGRGEVIERDEWIPGVSEGKRRLTESELSEFLEFSEVLFSKGREAFASKDLNRALTMYTQGVHLLEWVDGEGVEPALLRFYNNQSLVALKSEQYHEAKAAARRAYEIAPQDLKARYRLAEALYCLGELDAAAILYKELLRDEGSDASTRAAAANGLRKLQSSSTKWKSEFAFYSATATSKGTFAEGRDLGGGSGDESRTRVPSPVGAVRSPQVQSNIELKPKMAFIAGPGPTGPPANVLSLQKTIDLLLTLKQLYTSDTFEEQMRIIRSHADFDELKTLKGLQKHLPHYLGPVFDSCGLTEDYRNNKKKMDMSIQYWRPRDEGVSVKAKELYSIVLGDSNEE